MAEPFLGQISIFPCHFKSAQWLECSGQLLSCVMYSRLHSLIGTIYGGDGTLNFALPNLNGKAPMGSGTGEGLAMRVLGASYGKMKEYLLVSHLPPHKHLLMGSTQKGTERDSTDNFLASSPKTKTYFMYADPAKPQLTAMNGNCLSDEGGTNAHENRQPFLCFKFFIAISGRYPVRPNGSAGAR